jgi:hypothetical protein
MADAERADDGAEALCRQELAINPAAPAALRTLAEILRVQGRYEDMIALADSALAVQPQLGEAWLARGDALKSQELTEAALEAYRAAARSPEVAYDALVRCGLVLSALGRLDDAFEAYESALALQPEAPVARFGRGLLRLERRDFGAGWDDHESRWRAELFIAGSGGVMPPGLVPHLATNVSPSQIEGQRVLVIGEQGIGDQLMFASMLPDLARTAASVVCVCDPRLVGLFSASFENITATDPSCGNVEADMALAMGSLGCAFRRNAEDFPRTPYLRPRQEVRARWAERLGTPRARLRVGLSWRGGTPFTRRQSRSMGLDQLGPILDLPDFEFISLQYGDVADEVSEVNAGRANPIRLFPDAELHDFEELAGLTANCDVVVSVQTTLVHLAGALGQTCLALLPSRAEWRYTQSGETMPWYGSVRLFRQAEPGAWRPVVVAAAAALRSL